MKSVNDFKNIKTALVYDRVNTRYGGAEQVLSAFFELFPQADLYTSVFDQLEAKWVKNQHVKPSFLQNFPLAKSHHRFYLPLMPFAFENLDLSDYDLVISVTSAEAKGVITKPGQLHLCYLLSPPRYLYSHRKQYLQSRSIFKIPPFGFAAKKILDYLTWWDQVAIHRPDAIIPLSKLVQKRAKAYYDFETKEPIYPPINIGLEANSNITSQQIKQLNLPENFILTIARLVNYKRIDLAIKACSKTKTPLVVVGAGPEKRRLISLANKIQSKTIFLSNQPQAVVNYLFAKAKVVLCPGIDDFGLVPIQANYFGTPAVLNWQSGVAELIEDKIHGIYIKKMTVKSVCNALNVALDTKFDSSLLKHNAKQYNKEKFLKKFKNVVKKLL